MSPKRKNYFFDSPVIKAGTCVWDSYNHRGGHRYIYLNTAYKYGDKTTRVEVRSSALSRREKKEVSTKDIFKIKNTEWSLLTRDSYIVLSHDAIIDYNECLYGYENAEDVPEKIMERLIKAYDEYKERSNK